MGCFTIILSFDCEIFQGLYVVYIILSNMWYTYFIDGSQVV